MIGRWPTLLLLLSVYNLLLLTFFSSQKYSLLLLFKFFLFFLLSLLVFEGILASHFVGTFCPFDTLFLHPLSTAKASDDTRRKLDQRSFSPRSECYECSSSLSKLSFQRERERKRSQHSFLYTESKSPRLESLFQPTPAVFAPKKREHFFKSLLNARKFSRIKHLRVSRRRTTTKAQNREREKV